jgi:hypothetical protein
MIWLELGRPRRKCEDNIIRIDPREIWGESMDWLHLAQDMEQWLVLVYTIMKLLVS